MGKQNQKHKKINSARTMTIWLSNTGLGRAIYYPGREVICPILETGCDGDYPILYFFPKHRDYSYDEILKAFEQRINNPNNNKSFSTGADFARCGCEAKPLPVKRKELNKSETEYFLSLERKIKSECPEGIVYGIREDFPEDLKDVSKIKKESESLVTGLTFLEEFNKLYDYCYKSAEWVGNSELAEQFYKQRRA